MVREEQYLGNLEVYLKLSGHSPFYNIDGQVLYYEKVTLDGDAILR